MGVCSGRLKRGVLGAGTARKRGVLGAGPTRKKGGLRCGSGQKRGVFTAAHTYTEHICEYPPRGSRTLGSSQRLERCCLWWAALPPHGIGSEEVTLILLLLMVDSYDSNVVTLLIQPPSMQSRSGDNMIRPYSWILHSVRTLYGQMAEVNSPDLTCIKMIGTSVCYVNFFLLIEQFIRSRRSLFFRLMLTFSCCLHGFLRDQNFPTD